MFKIRSVLAFNVFLVMMLTSSCSMITRTIQVSNVKVEFDRGDFELSTQVRATYSQVKYLGIDWKSFKNKRVGVSSESSTFSKVDIPIIGDYTKLRTLNFALYKLLEENPGYDVVFYPQYTVLHTKPILGLGFVKSINSVTVTARLGKLL